MKKEPETFAYSRGKLRECMRDSIFEELTHGNVKRVSGLLGWHSTHLDVQDEATAPFNHAYTLVRQTGELDYPDNHRFMHTSG